MAQLNPYLTFNGNCREAMSFYRDCLGGKLKMQTAGESPAASQMPKELHNNILHAVLETEGITLMASDMLAAGATVNGNTVTLSLVCKTKEELEACFAKLSVGGKIGHPLTKQFFGIIGDFTDKFGFRWMCVFNPEALQ